MPVPRFGIHDPAELLRQGVFAQRVASPEIDVEMVDPPQGLSLACDDRMIAQAMANILKNAAEAISGRLDPKEKGRIRAELVVNNVGPAFVVEDNGVGLPSRDRDRLTEPYVTTREKGTGLGLAIVKRVLEEHGGDLTLSDAISLNGARVTLQFPTQKTADATASTIKSQKVVHGV
jgi:two-component system nitrogen regulation sensor histidine kinase NtrY